MEPFGEKPVIFVFTTAYHPFIGGAEVAIEEVVKRLANEFRFFIFTSRFRRDLPKREEQDGVVIQRIGFGFSCDKFLVPFLGFFVVRKYEKQFRPSLAWAVMASYASGIPYFMNLFRWGKPLPIVLTLQEGDSLKHILKARFGVIGISWRAALRRTHHLTAISAHLLHLGKSFGYRGEATRIANGVDVSAFVGAFPPDARSALLKSLGIAHDEKVLITTSRLVEKNAVDTAIRALALLVARGRRAKFLVLGSGEKEQMLRRLAAELGVSPHIRFLGSIPHGEIPKHLNIADAFVRVSRSEGLGNSFIEAMAAGVPVIGSRAGGIADFLEDGKTGLAVKEDDPADLAGAIERIFFDPALRARIVAGGLRVAGSPSYQWEAIARQYASVFTTARAQSMESAVVVATGLFPPDIGGPATYTKFLADALPREGLRVTVVNFGAFRHLPRGIRHLAYFFALKKRAASADIVYAQDPVSVGVPAALVSRLLGKKLVLKVVGDYAWEQGMQRFGVRELLDEFLKRRYGVRVEFFRHLQRFSARAARRIIVPSAYLKRVVGEWGIAPDKIRVVYNAFESEMPRVSREEARKAFGLSGTIAVSAGRLVPWKGFAVLIRCIPEVVKAVPDFTLVIAGSGPEETRLKTLAREAGIEKRVLFAGKIPQDEVLRYFRAGDVFVLNTAYEGFSHTILEAMAMDVPVLTTNVGGNPEVITSGENGVLVEYNDGEALTEAMVRLCRDRALREMLAANAKRTLSRFTTEKMLKETASLLKNLR